ncbi:hypothetical protein EG68_04130 [Paragonimus skrjabini miyazakii]|uniref:Rho-GAP domain-containing protein n=1 Tax=Paragonimus skrjabini miyazakii TaxID=59628 RepID=A0A8S9Z668_9TREM|nr:hypothetical protein EG68_04130 [Paragonimus skrjabini miyazakii]
MNPSLLTQLLVIFLLMGESRHYDIILNLLSFWAAEVQLIRDWITSPQVAAIVQKTGTTEHNVLFLFTGSRISPSVYADLTPSELIALDEVFRCEPDLPIKLRITGRRLTRCKRRKKSRIHVIRPAGDALQAPPVSNPADSDEPDEPVGVVYVTRFKETVERKPGNRKSSMFSCVLRFETAELATGFREKMLHCVRCGSRIVNDASDRSSFEVGKDALEVLDFADNDLWLDKYRVEVARYKLNNSVVKPSTQSTVRLKNGAINTSSDGRMIADLCLSDVESSGSVYFSSSSSSSSCGQDRNMTLICSSTDNVFKAVNSTNSTPHSSVHHSISSNSLKPRHESSGGAFSSNKQLSNSNDSGLNAVSIGDKQPVPDRTQSLRTAPTLGSSQSCADILETSSTLSQSRRKVKSFLEDHMFRSRLSNAEQLVRQQLLDRVDQYCTFESVRIFIGSWNVNGRQDANLSLDDWLMPLDDQPPADIYVIGFQELDLSLGAVALNKTSPAALEDRWTLQLQSALGGLLQPPSSKHSWFSAKDSSRSYAQRWSKHTGGGYQRLRRVRLAGILMIVYISAKLFRRANASEMSTQLVPTGVFNMMGNKGGVGLRLTLFNTALCFVNCHLAAGEANVERRNQDFQEIKRKMLFERRADVNNPNTLDLLTILDHDLIFVFGDLNYRINGLESNIVRRFIEKQEYSKILAYDELTKQCASNRAFGAFRESPINFAPTYKFDSNSQTYDSSEKNRVPSYCDRILWSGKHCEAICYRSHSCFTMSDHKPVSGYFKVGLRRVNRSLFQRAYEAVVRSQDLVYNLSLPQAQLENQELDFGPVRFYQVLQRTLTLTNIGLTGLEFQFLREGIADFPAWLTVSPETMHVEKNSTVQINVEIFVKPELVASLNSGSSTLSTIIVLRLLGGKDYFISISGNFVPTCFGLPLSLLLTLDTVPIAWMPAKELQEKINSARVGDWQEAEPSVLAKTDKPPFHIPKEVFRLTDFISQHLEEPELFRRSGQYGDVGVIRDMLDTTLPSVAFPETLSVHAAVFCLLVLLNTLTEAVIPQKFQAKCLEACNHFPSAIKALARVPVDHQNLFCYIVGFLRRCLTLSNKNGTDLQLLASSFGDVIFRDTTGSVPPSGRRNGRIPASNARLESTSLFMRHFLVNDPSTYFSGFQK